jgi:hypothetical protein
MLENLSSYKVTIENRLYQFVLSPDSPIQHAKESAFQYLKFLGQVEDKILADQKAQAVQVVEPVVEPVLAPTESA